MIAAEGSALAAWEADWRDHIADLKNLGCNVPYEASVERFRKVVASGLLQPTDIRDCPERFFMAHRVLAELATSLGPGFWIRFTVHYNLCSGTVVALGTDEQVAKLAEYQAAGKVGCFGLTEVFAGVNSGMIVNTTCTWDPDRKMFLLHSPDQGSYKNWISQGLTADICVVVADLRVGGKSFGPHAFLMEMRQNGDLVPGVEVGDMGEKTIGNDLDNAWISFQNVWLPAETLLSRYGYIENGQYVQRQKGIRTMDMIGQRLYTGRTVIARSALVFTRQLYASTLAYTDNKMCWAPKGKHMALSEVPQLNYLISETDAELRRLESFVDAIEERLAFCLREETLPPQQLVEAIAAAKVKCVEGAIDMCWRLKQEVGSYALTTGGGFERMDYLQCCKFAEGDTRILMQKMARDRVKAYQKGARGSEAEAAICEEIAAAGKKGDLDEAQLRGYKLAELMIERIMGEVLEPASAPASRL